jgi:hypothetical protein
MKMKHIKLFAVVMLGGLIMAGCKKKNNKEENEEELITTVKLTLTPAGGGSALVYSWKDVDGVGGNAPVIQTVTLASSQMYNCSVQFLNESVTPAEDITPEVVAEGTDHQVYYAASGGANLSINGFNTDASGLPLGTTAGFTTGAASTGFLKITLKHKPGVKASGDLVTKGETDVEVDMPVTIQ